MPLERTRTIANAVEVLDRVLDKGIVVDAWIRVSLVGIDLISLRAHVVVASIETYFKYANRATEGPRAVTWWSTEAWDLPAH